MSEFKALPFAKFVLTCLLFGFDFAVNLSVEVLDFKLIALTFLEIP